MPADLLGACQLIAMIDHPVTIQLRIDFIPGPPVSWLVSWKGSVTMMDIQH